MSHCENCNYNKSGKGVDNMCQYARYMSVVDEAKSDMEFPCEDTVYQEYLQKMERASRIPA